jgi:hypothetical protein
MDKSTFNINDWTLTLEDSKGTVAPVHFENVQPSEYPIQWGIYKSDVLGSNESETDRGFYEADATIDAKYLEQCKFNLRNHVDYKSIKDEIKQAVENVKSAAGAKAKVTSLAKEVVKLVENIFSGNMSGDNRFPENPTYSPQRLVLTQAVDSSYVRFQDADVHVMLTAVSPLSYNSFWNLEKNAKGIDMDLVDRVAAKLAKVISKVIKADLGTISITIPELKAGDDKYILVKTADGPYYTEVTIDEALYAEINEALAEGLTDIDISEAVSNTSGGKLVNTKNAERFSNFVERISNKYVSLMKKHALTRAVSPIILYDTTDGIKRLVDGTTVNAGYMVINMTSATKERIVPPYEKYIAVKDASGKIIYSATVHGNNQLQTLDLTKAGDYTIILSCMDYYGYVVTKKYDITVK